MKNKTVVPTQTITFHDTKSGMSKSNSGDIFVTDIGITGGGKDSNMLYLNGIQSQKLRNKEIISKVVEQVEKKAIEIQKKLK